MTDGSPPRIFLHIGTLKSGTSYIQGMLWRSRTALRNDGVLYPGESAWTEQVEAVRDAIGAGGPHRRPVQAGAWGLMAGQLLAWPGHTAIMSMELLSLAESAAVQEIVASLGPAEVHAVVTARDLARVIPSAWQESTQNRQTWTWIDYVAALAGDASEEPLAFRRFWKQHDLAAMATRWSTALGRNDRVHLVTVAPAGGPRDELWRRFCAVVGIDPDQYVVPSSLRGNPAVGAASAELLRRLNERVRGLEPDAYERVVKRFLAKQTLAHRTEEPRLFLPARYRDWVHERAEQMIAELRASGIDVVGDLDDLVPRPELATDDGELSEQEVADAAVHALQALVRELAGEPAKGERGSRRRRRVELGERR